MSRTASPLSSKSGATSCSAPEPPAGSDDTVAATSGSSTGSWLLLLLLLLLLLPSFPAERRSARLRLKKPLAPVTLATLFRKCRKTGLDEDEDEDEDDEDKDEDDDDKEVDDHESTSTDALGLSRTKASSEVSMVAAWLLLSLILSGFWRNKMA